MAQAELFEIDSPCISVCEMDDKGYCKGCLRNRTERQLWHVMNDEQKRQVLRLLFGRRHKQKIALAKLAKQASAGEAIVYSQLTFFEADIASDSKTDVTTNSVADLPLELAQKAVDNREKNPLKTSHLPKNEIVSLPNTEDKSIPSPKSATQTHSNTKDIKEQNWDFFAVLEASLL